MTVTDIDPADIGNERLRRFHAYWNARRGDRAFPRRADIDPVDFPYILGQIALVEVTDDPRVYRWRLVGNWWLEKFGIEATNTWVDDWPFAEQRQGVRRAYDKVRAARRPLVFARTVWLDRRKLACEVLMLPLSEDGQNISMIVVALVEI
jgi:hypothetical protein